MNTHIANVRRATTVPTSWVPEQRREINELQTLLKQYNWNTEDLKESKSAQNETIRFLIKSADSQVSAPNNK